MGPEPFYHDRCLEHHCCWQVAAPDSNQYTLFPPPSPFHEGRMRHCWSRGSGAVRCTFSSPLPLLPPLDLDPPASLSSPHSLTHSPEGGVQQLVQVPRLHHEHRIVTAHQALTTCKGGGMFQSDETLWTRSAESLAVGLSESSAYPPPQIRMASPSASCFTSEEQPWLPSVQQWFQSTSEDQPRLPSAQQWFQSTSEDQP